MSKVFLTMVLLFTVCSFVFSENMTLITFGSLPKGVTAIDGSNINKSVMENLQDLNEIINNVYIRSDILEKWINYYISNINITNTNMVKQGNKMVPSKKISPISLKTITPTLLKTVNSYVKIDYYVTVSFAAANNGSVVNFVFQNGLGAVLGKSSVFIDTKRILDKLYINKIMKEAIVTMYNLWPRYTYDLQKTGSITFAMTPKTSTVFIKSLNMVLKCGNNSGIPYGTYMVVISNAGFNTVLTNITVGDKPATMKITLSKFTPFPIQPGMPPTGHLYLDTDLAGTMFVIVEDGVMGRLPMMISNIKGGEKTIVIQETPEYRYRMIGNILRMQQKVSGVNVMEANELIEVWLNKPMHLMDQQIAVLQEKLWAKKQKLVL